MFSAADAERLIFTLVSPVETVETVPLGVADCLGRVLAAPVTSSLDFPHWDNSAMDGYAVRASDVQTAPTQLSVVEEIPAGRPPQKTVGAGQAARILTGAMMPAGADTVVMQEETQRQASRTDGAEDAVLILKVPQPGAFVRRRGSFYQAGDAISAGAIA